MAVTTIGGQGFWLPTKGDESAAIANNVYILDASSEKVTVTFQVPKSGNLDGFEMTIPALGNAPDNGLKCSLQSADPTSGLATGTILASGNAHVTTSGGTPSATGWFNPGSLGASVGVSAGDVVVAVVEFGGAGFTASDSISFGHTSRCGDTGLPFGTSATGTKQASTLPIIALRYDDGSYCMVDDEIWPSIANGNFDIDTGTAQNEAGLRFTVPVSLRLRAVNLFLSNAATSGGFEVYVYNAAGTTIAGPITVDGDWSAGTTAGSYWLIPLPTSLTLAANSEYIVGVKPTTTVNVLLWYYTFNSTALMNAIPGGSECYAIARAWSGGTPGAWTRYNNGTDGYRRTRVFLGFDGVA